MQTWKPWRQCGCSNYFCRSWKRRPQEHSRNHSVRDERDQYRIAVKSGILKGLYSRNQFDLCPQKLLTLDHVSQEQSISLRSAVIAESKTGGQGFTKCNCQDSKKCQTKRCKCFKARLQCNSRCHSSLNCPNK